MRLLDRPRVRIGISAFILFTGWASDAWRNLFGWYVFGGIVLLVVAGGVLLLVHSRSKLTLNALPIPLLLFLLLATVSIAWSAYRLSSVLGVATTWMTVVPAVGVALSLNWAELLRALGWAFRAILALSYLFELIVSLVIRHPIFPVWLVPDDPENPAKLLYWSRNLLLEGGKIQGIIGNSSLLGMVSLVALVVFAIQLASRSVTRVGGSLWLLLAAATIVLTRSATIVIGLAVVVLVATAAWLVRRARTRTQRRTTYAVMGAIGAGAIITGLLLRDTLVASLGKSADFSGRVGIWDAVIGLAQERPFGWGWISYWVPWEPPFDNLIVRGGVQVMHAHNAWLDLWLQLGILGLVVFGVLVLGALVRSWWMATDSEITSPGRSVRGPRAWILILPLLVLSAQVVQSLAESRILIEGGLMLIVIFAVRTKLEADRSPDRDELA